MKGFTRNRNLLFAVLLLLVLVPGIAYVDHLLNSNTFGDTNADGISDEPIGRFTITSDHGPRDVTDGSFFHTGIDYRLEENAGVPVVEGGGIVRISRSMNLVVVSVQNDAPNPPHNPMPMWRYLHMFSQSNGSPDVPGTPSAWTNGDFSLIGTTPFTIIEWAQNHNNRTRAIRALTVGNLQTTVANPYHPGTNILNDATGNDIVTTDRVGAGETIGPCGNSGLMRGTPHIHIDLGLGATVSPFFHLNHPRTQLIVEELPGEPFTDMSANLATNFNGQWDQGEPYTEIDNNGVYTQDAFLPPAQNAVVFYTPDHHYERLRYRVTTLKQNPDFPQFRDWYSSPFDFDRLRVFLYPANTALQVSQIDFSDEMSFAQNQYLINNDAPGQAPTTPPSDDQIFRAELNLGGRPDNEVVDGIDIGQFYPPFVRSGNDNATQRMNALSLNGMRTGVRINDVERVISLPFDATLLNANVGDSDYTRPDAGSDEYVFNQWHSRINASYTDRDGDMRIDNAVVNVFPANPSFAPKYPDGRYLLVAYAEDVNRDESHAALTPTDRSIVVDNFRPFAKQVAITAQNENIYVAEWVFDPGNGMYTIEPNTLESYLGRNVDVTVTVIFNEPIAYEDTDGNLQSFIKMTDDTLKLDPLGPNLGAPAIRPLQPPEFISQIPLDRNAIQATFRFVIPEASKNDFYGDAAIVVDVRDLGKGLEPDVPDERGNKLLFIADQTSTFNPVDHLHRDAMGNLRGNDDPNNPGQKLPLELQRDTYHKIQIDPVEPVAMIRDNTRHQPELAPQSKTVETASLSKPRPK